MNYKNDDDGFKTIFTIAIVASLILIGAFILGKGSGSKDSQNNQSGNIWQLQSTEKVYDFGTISMADGNVEKIFKVTNSGDKDIILKKVTTSCMCTTAYVIKGDSKVGPFGMAGMGYISYANETIKPGKSLDIKVVYDPNAHGPSGVGFIDRFIYLEDNNGGKMQLEIKAMVKP